MSKPSVQQRLHTTEPPHTITRKDKVGSATRYPYRPNPLGISIVKLLSREENILTVEGIDILDGTPLLDIKPYVPDFDLRTEVRTGWYETRSKK